MATSSLRFVFGDQLDRDLPSLRDLQPEHDVIWMCEVDNEATHIRHHQKKLVAVFSAMRHFANALGEEGLNVHYTTLDDPDNGGCFTQELERAIATHAPERIVITRPSEHRVLREVERWCERWGEQVTMLDDDRFYCSLKEFASWMDGRRQPRMEHFYRDMRKTHGVLMTDDGQPCGERWNFDTDNRHNLSDAPDVPPPFKVEPDTITTEVCSLVEARFGHHFGTVESFHFAVTRPEALNALEDFIAHRLPHFGTYQDAMKTGDPWLFHSHLSVYLNLGLLRPQECVNAAEAAYHDGSAPLNAVEGFVRQILGWREYVRGLYWHVMPGYTERNALDAHRPLPRFFWDADTAMNCVHQAVRDTQQHAYAHHIQRLMVLGNFALLAGLDPQAVNTWYWIVYADAYEWVELPNVSGMALFADGGLLASKPYAASGRYVNKMSDYCQSCRYNVHEKHGPSACPFNTLYWDFLMRNAERLQDNPRMRFPYRNLERMDNTTKQAIRKSAGDFLEALPTDDTEAS